MSLIRPCIVPVSDENDMSRGSTGMQISSTSYDVASLPGAMEWVALSEEVLRQKSNLLKSFPKYNLKLKAILAFILCVSGLCTIWIVMSFIFWKWTIFGLAIAVSSSLMLYEAIKIYTVLNDSLTNTSRKESIK